MTRLPGSITQKVMAPWGLQRLHSDGPFPDLLSKDKWGKYKAGFKFYYYSDACGQNVTIYILDDLIRPSHFQFKKISRVIYENGKPTKKREDETARIDESKTGYKVKEDHGIAIAAIAAGLTYGVAPAAEVVGIGYVEGDELLEKMEGFQTPAVLNISNQFFPTKEMTRALVTLIKKGVHVVVAAGNEHIPLVLPEWDLSEVTAENEFAEDDKDHLDSIIWVAASTPEDTKRRGSAYGPNIDLFAPGDFTYSATNESDTSSGTGGGTSDAAPHVTGIIACLLSHDRYKTLTPKKMKDKIKAMAWPTAMKLPEQDDELRGTTTRLASCHINRWTLGDPPEEGA